MARNQIDVAVPPERVFAVLSDPQCYAEWVVGSRDVRAADPRWPAKGTRFHHVVTVAGVVDVLDYTEVKDVEPGRRLALSAKARPLGSAHVELELEPQNGGTRVTMIEHPEKGLPGRLVGLAADPVIKLRNAEALRRLKALSERR